MPRDSTGNATLDPIYIATPGQTILAAQHNTPLQDIQSMLTGSLARNGAGGMQANLPMNGYRVTGMGAGTSPDDAATVAQATANGINVGDIIESARRTPADGFLWADGRAVLRADYPELDDAIYCGNEENDTAPFGYHATTDVDPSDNRSISGAYLILPDRREVTGVGRSDMGNTTPRGLLSNFVANVLGALFGSQEHTLTVSEMPEHNHGGSSGAAGAHAHGPDAPRFVVDVADPTGTIAGGAPGTSLDLREQTASVPNHVHSISSQGGGSAHNNVQPTIAMNYFIKAFSV